MSYTPWLLTSQMSNQTYALIFTFLYVHKAPELLRKKWNLIRQIEWILTWTNNDWNILNVHLNSQFPITAVHWRHDSKVIRGAYSTPI